MTNKSLDGATEQGLDAIDRRILRVLQGDGRIPNLKLADTVGLSPTAVLARVQRLTRDAFILGYEARLNPLKLNAGMLVFVEVLLDRTAPNVFDQFKAAVQVRPEIQECHMVAGGFDYLLKLRVPLTHTYRSAVCSSCGNLVSAKDTTFSWGRNRTDSLRRRPIDWIRRSEAPT